MDDLSILIGGKAGDGIDRAGTILAHILDRLNYRLYIYRDYPSLIRGGHTFSLIRAARRAIAAHNDTIDFLIALNQECADLHANRLREASLVIVNTDLVKGETVCAKGVCLNLPMEQMVKEEGAPEITRNSCAIGAWCRAVGIGWEVLEDAFRHDMTKELEVNLKVARKGYDAAKPVASLTGLDQKRLPVVTGNEAIGLGLIAGGLDTYIAYPMTPSSPILHFLAGAAGDYGLKVIHPESEIAVMLMALGFSYTGERVAVGTSGGGFCLMTEGLSLAGMAELPVVIVLGQRPGPSTGLPTYTAQTELFFALHAGQGEFPRLVVAPGDAAEAFSWSQTALAVAMKYRIPAIILSDKTIGEGAYSFDIDAVPPALAAASAAAQEAVPVKKVNSYEHDDAGITTEDPEVTSLMQEKRLHTTSLLLGEMEAFETVSVSGRRDARTALISWGSNKGVCDEVADALDVRSVHVKLLEPFPVERFRAALAGVKRTVAIENNATAQFVTLLGRYGFTVNEKVLRYDGRPFSVDDLKARLTTVIRS